MKKNTSKKTTARATKTEKAKKAGSLAEKNADEIHFDASRLSCMKLVETDAEADELVRMVIFETTGTTATLEEMRRLSPGVAAKWEAARAAIRPGEMTRLRAEHMARDIFAYGKSLEPLRDALHETATAFSLPLPVLLGRESATRWDGLVEASAKWKSAFAVFAHPDIMRAGRFDDFPIGLFELDGARDAVKEALSAIMSSRVRVPESVTLAASFESAFDRYFENIKKNRDEDLSSDFNDLADKLSGLVATMKNGTPTKAPSFDADGNLDAETLQRARLQIEREALEKDAPKITCLKLYRNLKKSLKPGAALDTLFTQHVDTWKSAFPRLKTKSSLRVELGKLGECFPDPEKANAKKARNAASRRK